MNSNVNSPTYQEKLLGEQIQLAVKKFGVFDFGSLMDEEIAAITEKIVTAKKELPAEYHLIVEAERADNYNKEDDPIIRIYGNAEYDAVLDMIVDDEEYTTETAKEIKSLGSICPVFTEVEIFNESITASAIKEVTRKDVTSKHFRDWFFQMDEMSYTTPKDFHPSTLTHSDEISVYGYFNENKLDGIIRVDKYDDRYELSFFFVNETLQHKGIGQYLFQFVLSKFRNKKLILNVYKDNSPAIHIYKKYGFKIVGIRYGKGYRPELPHYIMQRSVNDSHYVKYEKVSESAKKES